MPWVEHQLHNSSSVASVFSGFDWLEQAVYVDSTIKNVKNPRKRSQRKVRRENQRELIKENEEMKNEVLKYLDKNNQKYYKSLHPLRLRPPH
jgi:hypothetical protein